MYQIKTNIFRKITKEIYNNVLKNKENIKLDKAINSVMYLGNGSLYKSAEDLYPSKIKRN